MQDNNTEESCISTDTCCSTDSCCGSASSEVAISEKAACTEAVQKDMPEWVCGTLKTPVGTVYQVSTEWTRKDRWGQIKARTTSYRMHYTVPPGLYAAGEPNENSDVFVSANYKLSFDVLRRELRGMNAWILVLDTKGINVWCAAGKGTFGTDELVHRIAEVQLENVVTHKRIIVPQLGAVGVNSAAVKQRTGFRVYFGPVYAKDIPAYVNANHTASQEMRRVKFPLLDRLVLTPMELIPMLKKFPAYALIILLIFGLQPSGILFKDAWIGGRSFLGLGLIAILAGAFLTPALLPFVLFRSFAIKGWFVGILAVFVSLQFVGKLSITNPFLLIMTYLFFPLAASYIALQFTGSTTFTGLSGVKKELKIGIPVYITGTVLSAILLIIYKFSQWGIV
jgi:hypothetical protein